MDHRLLCGVNRRITVLTLTSFITNIGKIMSRYWYIWLVKGIGYTLLFSVIALFFGTIIGSLFAMGRLSKIKPLKWLIVAIVEVVRGTPTLLQLYWCYFFIPMLFPVLNFGPFLSVSIALVINSSAYVSEIIRSGIEAVDKGQTEAARSLGLSGSVTMAKIVFPQAVKNILPALGNEFITVVKETSLASTFFVGELMTSYLIVKGNTYLSTECLVIVGIIYFLLTSILSRGLKFVERKLKAHA